MKGETLTSGTDGQVATATARVSPLRHASRDSAPQPRGRASTKIQQETRLERLARWRQSLKRLETEAAKARCIEIEVLAGVAALAVEDLIDTAADEPQQSLARLKQRMRRG